VGVCNSGGGYCGGAFGVVVEVTVLGEGSCGNAREDGRVRSGEAGDEAETSRWRHGDGVCRK